MSMYLFIIVFVENGVRHEIRDTRFCSRNEAAAHAFNLREMNCEKRSFSHVEVYKMTNIGIVK